MVDIRAKRVYDPPSAEDGLRVLVDRVWPRGMSKEKVQAHMWCHEIAPSTALRKWFGHDRTRWEEFKRRYFAELDAQREAVAQLAAEAAKGRLTLLFSARDADFNQAVALKEYLLTHFFST